MTTRRPGFTLIELFVAVAIVVLVIGLTLPAIQRVRAAAAQAHCVNNLRQVGQATAQYHGARGRLPYAGWPQSAPPAGRVPFDATAHVFLTGYLGHESAQRSIAAASSSNSRPAALDGRTDSGVAVVVIPMIPTRTESHAGAPASHPGSVVECVARLHDGSVSVPATRMFAPSHANSACRTLAASVSTPQSNSWFPNAAAAYPMWL